MSGPGSGFSKEDGALLDAKQKVISARSDVTSQLTNLQNRIESMRAQWTGSSGLAFQNVVQRWNQDAKKMLTALDALAEKLGEAEQAYNVADEGAAAIFQRANG